MFVRPGHDGIVDRRPGAVVIKHLRREDIVVEDRLPPTGYRGPW